MRMINDKKLQILCLTKMIFSNKFVVRSCIIVSIIIWGRLLRIPSHKINTKELHTTYETEIKDGFDYKETIEPNVTNVKNQQIDSMVMAEPQGERNITSQSKKISFDQYCKEYMKNTKMTYRIIRGPHAPSIDGNEQSHDRICMTTQLTISKFGSLQRIADFWQGCISAVIYGKEDDIKSLMPQVASWLDEVNRQNVYILYVLARGDLYPVNKLRNMATDNAISEFVFAIDVDFVPNPGLQHQLEYYIETGFFDKDKIALVVPAFEQNDNKTMPASKTEILQGLENKSVRTFHWFWKRAQNATQYKTWTSAMKPYQISYQLEYEPYMLVRRVGSPRYDERFMHRFKNKCIFTFALYKQHYKFWVMPEGFIVHMPHKYFDERGFQYLKECVNKLWRQRSKIVNTHHQ